MTTAPRFVARALWPALAAATLLVFAPVGAGAESRAPIKVLEARKMAAEPMHERRELAESARERHSLLRKLARQLQRAGGSVLRVGGVRARPMIEDEDTRYARNGRLAVPLVATPTSSGAVTGPPRPNQRCNNTAGDGALDGQCETSIVRWNNKMVAAWNDGTGFTDLSNQTQGWATSADGGVTWTDQGKFPLPPATVGWEWASDPVLAVNSATGAFYFTALIDSAGTVSALGVLKGRFNGAAFSWGTIALGTRINTTVGILDKEWMAVDPVSGRVSLSYTNFISGAISQIESVTGDSALANWTPPAVISTSGEAGYVQGSRPAVGPDGTIYVVYYLIGQVDVDYFRIAKSVNGGRTFSAPVDAASFYSNFDTGAPGFNRPAPDPTFGGSGGVQFPSIAVDRSGGAHNGRIYLSWPESLNWYDDIPQLGHLGITPEIEPNDAFGAATPLAVGQEAAGSLNNSSDIFDWYSISLAAGQSVIVAVDSLASGMAVSTRMFATDGATRLTYGIAVAGDVNSGVLSAWLFTAPATATYYLRVATFGSASGRYHVTTGPAAQGSERGRDQRDVFTSYSDNSGASWSTPVRVNDDPVGYDDWLPEIAVGDDGQVYAAWYDWRDAAPGTSGGESNVYLARSSDGGATWAELGSTSDVRTAWTAVQSNIIPNEGDYLSLFADAGGVSIAWSDGRASQPDVFMSFWTKSEVSTLPALVSAVASPGRVDLRWSVGTPAGFAVELYKRVTGAATFDSLGTLLSAPDGSITYADTSVALGESYDYRLGVMQGGVEFFYGQVTVRVNSAVPPGLALAGARPNPATNASVIAFTLTGSGAATLELLDLNGRRVSSREVGAMGAGPHSVPVTTGERLRPGVYFVRLTQAGATRSRRIVVL